MKATDLMIGDYVFCDWVTHKVYFDGDVMTDRGYKVSRRIIKVSSVNEGGITFKSLKDGSQISIKEEDLVPIPLTQEILEKNYGKETQVGISDKPCWGEMGAIWSTMLWKCENSFWLEVSTIASGFVKKHILYVHELQHALRLCGIEKEIEL